MNVLSLFDGMSCGRIALDRAGIVVDQYYASELDKYAITVTQANWPETIQMGDVTKWKEWDIDWASINLLIGGSPCQGFSFAGKQLAFDDPRSMLFFVYVDILRHIKEANPDVQFMLENVKMKKEYLQVISEMLGTEPILINSALVSAQNRQRYYWASWDVDQPEDKGILLKDILEHGEIGKEFYYSEKSIAYMERGNEKWTQAGARRADRYTQTADTEKAFTLTANFHKGVPYNYFCEASQDVVIIQKGRGNNPGGIRAENGKTPCLSSSAWEHNNHLTDGKSYRKLTPVECERLQTAPDGYTNHVSNTQRYKMLGNGWTVDVIAHIFRQSPFGSEVSSQKLTQINLFIL